MSGKRNTITRIDERKVKPSEMMMLFCWGKKILVEVDKVDHKKYSELNGKDAESEGFRTLSEFQEELTKVYGRRVKDDALFTVVTFHIHK